MKLWGPCRDQGGNPPSFTSQVTTPCLLELLISTWLHTPPPSCPDPGACVRLLRVSQFHNNKDHILTTLSGELHELTLWDFLQINKILKSKICLNSVGFKKISTRPKKIIFSQIWHGSQNIRFRPTHDFLKWGVEWWEIFSVDIIIIELLLTIEGAKMVGGAALCPQRALILWS